MERFGVGARIGRGSSPLAQAGSRPPTRRLGRNPESGAIAVLGVHAQRAWVAIVQESSCLTWPTWNQFVPRLG